MASSNNVIDEIKASGSSASNTVPLTSNEPTNGALDKEMNGTATRASTPDGEEAAECGCGDESSNAKEAPVDDDIPSAKDFAKAYSLPVLDSDGKEHTFKSLVSRAGIDKHLVIFIRHFFCSLCQDYIEQLSTILPPSSLPATIDITIISNGHSSYINKYKSLTKCPYEIYVDPGASPLYQVLGLKKTQDFGTKPSYVKKSLFATIVAGITQGIGAGRNSVRGGNFLQVGGEFLFVKETEDEFKCTWAHRMKTTRGHSDVETLRDLLLGKPAAAEQETAAIPVPSAVAVGAVPAMPTVPEKTAVNAVKKSDRLSRRLSGRLSALLRKDSNENGVKSEKANGKAPAVDQSVVVPAEPVVAETLAPVQPELTMNGGTIRPVIGSPVL